MSRVRQDELWSPHAHAPAKPSAGSPFERGHPLRVSCIRCGVHRPRAEMESDVRIKHQRRCIDREMCASARKGLA